MINKYERQEDAIVRAKVIKSEQIEPNLKDWCVSLNLL